MSARSLNKITLIGNLTRDPELKYTPKGTAVCTFGIATNRSWKTTEGQTKEDTQYHRVVAWNKLAELCGKLLAKGRKVYLEGRLVYRTFTGKDGIQRTVSEIVMNDFILFSNGRYLDAKEEGAGEKTYKTSAADKGGDEDINFNEITADDSDGEGKSKEDKDKKTKEDKGKKSDASEATDDDIPF